MEVLVILGLLTEEELEKYLKALGDMDGDDSLDMDNDHDVKMDPLLSLGVGEDKSILDAELLGPDGLLNVDLGDKNLLNLGGDGPLLNLGGKDKGLLGLGGVLRRRGDGLDRLADVDVITHSRLLRSRSTQGLDDLVDAQVGGKKDNHQAAIDLDVATHERRADKGLLDAQVGGEKNGNDAAIDLDILTHDGKNNGNGGSGSEVQDGNDNHHDPYYLSLYQPVCKKGFKKEHRDAAEHCHAQDANHCLAICHSRGALLTIEADAQVGDVANILLCAAVEFDNSESGDNCHYYVAPETEPCHDDQLEEKENCYTFVRN